MPPAPQLLDDLVAPGKEGTSDEPFGRDFQRKGFGDSGTLRRGQLRPTFLTELRVGGILKLTFRALSGHCWSLLSAAAQEYQGMGERVN